MTLKQLLAKATDKERFSSIEAYVEFARVFLGYVVDHIQATIVLQKRTAQSLLAVSEGRRGACHRHEDTFLW